MDKLSDSPATRAAAVMPSNTAELDMDSRGLYVGVTGDVKVTTVEGDTVTFKALAAGVVHAIAVKRVFSTGTTATDIVAVW